MRNGCWETYHSDGKKASKGTWSDDVRDLKWVYWSETGDKRKEKLGGEAKHGKCIVNI